MINYPTKQLVFNIGKGLRSNAKKPHTGYKYIEEYLYNELEVLGIYKQIWVQKDLVTKMPTGENKVDTLFHTSVIGVPVYEGVPMIEDIAQGYNDTIHYRANKNQPFDPFGFDGKRYSTEMQKTAKTNMKIYMSVYNKTAGEKQLIELPKTSELNPLEGEVVIMELVNNIPTLIVRKRTSPFSEVERFRYMCEVEIYIYIQNKTFIDLNDKRRLPGEQRNSAKNDHVLKNYSNSLTQEQKNIKGFMKYGLRKGLFNNSKYGAYYVVHMNINDNMHLTELYLLCIKEGEKEIIFYKGEEDYIYPQIKLIFPSIFIDESEGKKLIKRAMRTLENRYKEKTKSEYKKYVPCKGKVNGEVKGFDLGRIIAINAQKQKRITSDRNSYIKGPILKKNIINNTADLLQEYKYMFDQRQEVITFQMPFRADMFYKFNKCSTVEEAMQKIDMDLSCERVRNRHIEFLDLISCNGRIIYKYRTYPIKNEVIFTLNQ